MLDCYHQFRQFVDENLLLSWNLSLILNKKRVRMVVSSVLRKKTLIIVTAYIPLKNWYVLTIRLRSFDLERPPRLPVPPALAHWASRAIFTFVRVKVINGFSAKQGVQSVLGNDIYLTRNKKFVIDVARFVKISQSIIQKPSNG